MERFEWPPPRLVDRELELGQIDERSQCDLRFGPGEWGAAAVMVEEPLGEDDATVGIDTFMMLVDCVQRCTDAGRFAPGDALDMARQMWVLAHGTVTLELAHLMTPAEA